MFEELTATKQRVTFRVLEPLVLPEYKGATFRGALGFAFKRIACALPRKTCDTCLLRERCAYSVCFETPVPAGSETMRKYPFAPHPFVLEPPVDGRRSYQPGEELALNLCLVGRGNDYLAHFIYAFEEMGSQGLGRDRAKCELGTVVSTAAQEKPIYDHAKQSFVGETDRISATDIIARAEDFIDIPIRIVFETPTRVKSRGNLTDSPDLGVLFPALLRRLNSLNYFHCGGPSDVDVKPVLEAARATEVERRDVQWIDWDRYSGRQQRRMKLGGFVGTVDYPPLDPVLLPALLWGELLHMGKASAFGLGKFRLEKRQARRTAQAPGFNDSANSA